jgi:hypothetical protein
LTGTPKAEQEGSPTWHNYEFANGKDAMEIWVFPADGIERGRSKAKKPIAVKGLGEDAFFDRGMHGLDYVNLLLKKGNITIQISLKETAGDEDKIRTIGQKAIGRLEPTSVVSRRRGHAQNESRTCEHRGVGRIGSGG